MEALVRRLKLQSGAVFACLLVVVSFVVSLILVQSNALPVARAIAAAPVERDIVAVAGLPQLAVTQVHTVTLPLVVVDESRPMAFGTESNISLTRVVLLSHAANLGVGSVRVNGRISWNFIQPNEGDPIRWERLLSFEDELRTLKAAGLTPAVIVDDYPLWATNGALGGDGLPSHCAPIRAEKMPAFASFLRALVARYKVPEFDVHRWELGNEPDVDPRMVDSNSAFGCWGNIDDPYYGGEQYGEMLKAVVPGMRAEDPRVVILPGGLLLSTPHTVRPERGHPELFLEGILRAGAGPFFDEVPYHAYPEYINVVHDYDLNAGPWTAWGGNTLGKAAYLQQIMDAYGVDKPLVLNETGLMCSEYYQYCVPPDATFFWVQAMHATRSFARGLAGGVDGFVWYTLNGPGWRYTGLTDEDGNPMPVYWAYQELIDQLGRATFMHAVDHGPEIEAYAFQRGPTQVQVVWAIEDEMHALSIPDASFLAAYDWAGTRLDPPLVDSNRVVAVGFDPVYLVLTR